MKRICTLLLLPLALHCAGQGVDQYFEKIRNNTAELTAFFSAMPKGGDLHNHYSGSVYAETYICYVVTQDYVINTQTLEVRDTAPDKSKVWEHFSALDKKKTLASYKQKLIQKWSVKDYNGVSYPSDKQFFETFGGFGIANNSVARLDTGIMELKRRAQKEHVDYIETMFTGIPCSLLNSIDNKYNGRLEAIQATRDANGAQALLDELYQAIQAKNPATCAIAFNDTVVARMHYGLGIDDSTFTMRYQNYVNRTAQPLDVFKSMVVCFESADRSPLVVGVNIVAPEDNEVSMRDYWLHMQMFRYCHNKYPKVKIAMHAGELALGMVKPEDMTWHISEAVHTVGPNRIGHGVDMPYEHNCYDLLRFMAKSKTAIEINLYSNEFILKVKDDAHPFTLYREYNVPIVICTDDAGVLRSNLIHQYVLLAKRYKDVSYKEIKKYVYNSIEYSFIKEDSVKTQLKARLDREFKQFEHDIMASRP